jgi:hypothetical protein
MRGTPLVDEGNKVGRVQFSTNDLPRPIALHLCTIGAKSENIGVVSAAFEHWQTRIKKAQQSNRDC